MNMSSKNSSFTTNIRKLAGWSNGGKKKLLLSEWLYKLNNVKIQFLTLVLWSKGFKKKQFWTGIKPKQRKSIFHNKNKSPKWEFAK